MEDRRAGAGPNVRVRCWLPLLLVGCNAHADCPPAAKAPVVAVAPLAEIPPLPAKEQPAPKKPSACWGRGRPKPRGATTAKESTFCAALDMQEVALVEARVRRDYEIDRKPSKLVIDFGCDLAWKHTKDVVFETGSGHGGSLNITRFSWADPQSVQVRLYKSRHYHDVGVTIEDASVLTTTIDPVLEKARVALLVRPHLVPLFDRKGGLGAGGGSGSSADHHALLRIEDLEGNVTEASFTGYPSSLEQDRRLPLVLASEPMTKLLGSLKPTASAVTDADRAFITQRFLTTMANKPYWWVKERYVKLVGTLGTIDAVPALLPLVDPKGSNASDERTRLAAIEAIAALTGWNPAIDADGKERSREEIARVVAEECAL